MSELPKEYVMASRVAGAGKLRMFPAGDFARTEHEQAIRPQQAGKPVQQFAGPGGGR